MAYPSLAEQGVTPVFDSMMEQDLLQNNLFAFYLTMVSQDAQSELTFGYYDSKKFTGEMRWHPVRFKYMFGLQLDDILVNGKSLGFCGPNGIKQDCLLTVDSGTTMMSMPGWAYNQLPKDIPRVDRASPCES